MVVFTSLADMGGGLEYPLDRSGSQDFISNGNPLLLEFEEKQARNWKVADEAEPKDLTELRSGVNLGLGFVPKEVHSVVPDYLRYSPDYWDPMSDGDHFPDFYTNQGMRGQGTSSYVQDDFWDIPNGDNSYNLDLMEEDSDNDLRKQFQCLKESTKHGSRNRKRDSKSKKNRRLPFVVLGEDASVVDRKLMLEAYDTLDAVAPKADVPIWKLVISLWLDQLEHNFLLRDFVKRMLNMGLSEFLDQMCLQEPFAEYQEKETIIRRIHNWTLLTPEMKSSFLGIVEIQ